MNPLTLLRPVKCFWHFDHAQIMPKLFRVLKSNGSLLVLCMAWLPFEDEIAGASERLVLKYNPSWSGAGEPIPPIEIPACHTEKFDLVYHDEYSLQVPFPRGSWNGRMKARRGTGVPFRLLQSAYSAVMYLSTMACRVPSSCSSSRAPLMASSSWVLPLATPMA